VNALARFDISEGEITEVVQAFYRKVRRHPTLGPVFAAHVAPHQWPEHEAKIVRFWRNAILLDHSYSGNPMRTHMKAGNVKAAHFDTWLTVFDETVQAELRPETAAAFSDLAHRIGRGLRFGIEDRDAPADGIPRF